jgi:hypothetical protein
MQNNVPSMCLATLMLQLTEPVLQLHQFVSGSVEMEKWKLLGRFAILISQFLILMNEIA